MIAHEPTAVNFTQHIVEVEDKEQQRGHKYGATGHMAAFVNFLLSSCGFR